MMESLMALKGSGRSPHPSCLQFATCTLCDELLRLVEVVSERGGIQIAASVILLATCLASSTALSDEPIRLPALQVQAAPVDPSTLREIEDHVLPPPLVPGPARHKDLRAYYWAANEKLKQRFEQAQRAYEHPSNGSYRSLTLVAGAPGVGKTFLKGGVFRKQYADHVSCRFDIRALYEQWQADRKTTAKPDLCAGTIVLSRLLSQADGQTDLVRDFLESQQAAFYVIDSLDEIHPDDYLRVLRQIEAYIFDQPHRFVHVVVFGRWLAFRDYWQHRSPSDHRNIALFMLEPPVFRTTGDLLISSWNYHTWKYNLAWSPDGGPPVPMPLGAYVDWVANGYPRSGRYASVSLVPNESTSITANGKLLEWSQRHRTVCATLYNLAGNSMIRKIAEQHVRNGWKYNEQSVMRAYLSQWLERDTDSDDRPSPAKPEYLELYLQLLEQVAVKYLQEGRLDEAGFFPVEDEEVVEVTFAGRDLKFPVKRILNRSGLKYIDPRKPGTARYRFEPVWIHRLLVEMHNERMLQPSRPALPAASK